MGVLIARGVTIDTKASANSPHPSSREGHLSAGWLAELEWPLLFGFAFRLFVRLRAARSPLSSEIPCRLPTSDA